MERELRVAARKRSTFWLRIIAAMVASIIAAGYLALSAMGWPGSSRSTLGQEMFTALTWLSLATALSAGVFFTSDCLSEEKREGTLGFLFLTELRGYDVVLGKLLATSLRACFALLAAFPVLAMTLLLGGVTGPQFWKTVLALVNALFFSLAGGLLVSAISRDSQRALGMTLFLLVLVLAGGPLLDAALAASRLGVSGPVFRLGSPGWVYAAASGGGASRFWLGFLTNQIGAWLMLAAACLLIPRAWQEKPAKRMNAQGHWAHRWKYGSAAHRANLRRSLVGLNPVLWLACRERRQALALWVIAILAAVGFIAVCASSERGMGWMVWSQVGGLLTLVVYLRIASQAGLFFFEAQRSGLFELLMSTPLTAQQIIQGQWRAMLRQFSAPLILLLAVQLLGSFWAQQTMWIRMAVAAPPPKPVAIGTNTTVSSGGGTNVTVVIPLLGASGTAPTAPAGPIARPGVWVSVITSAAGTLAVLANLVAICWFGMWMGLTSKNNNIATLKTIAFVQIIPWFAIAFMSAAAAGLVLIPMLKLNLTGGSSPMVTWFPLLFAGLASVIALAKDAGFILLARSRLYSQFRERAMPDRAMGREASAPPLMHGKTS